MDAIYGQRIEEICISKILDYSTCSILDPIGVFSAMDTSYSSDVKVGGLSLESIGEIVTNIVLTISGTELV